MSSEQNLEDVKIVKCKCHIIKKINNKNVKLLSPPEIYKLIKEGQKICNLCQIDKIDKIDKFYSLIKTLKYHEIKEFIPLELIVRHPIVSAGVLETCVDNISYSDLSFMLDSPKIDIPEVLIVRLCSRIINISKLDITDELNIPMMMLKRIMKNTALLSKHYKKIMEFIIDLLILKKIKKISDSGIHLADYSMLLEICLEKTNEIYTKLHPNWNTGSEERLASSQIEQLNKKNDELMTVSDIVIEESTFFRLREEFFDMSIKNLSYSTHDKMLGKLDSIIEYVSSVSISSYLMKNRQFELVIEPSNLFDSCDFSDTEKMNALFSNLSEKSSTKVVYKNKIGIDASGLTKDVYGMITTELINNFEEIDSYMLPKRDSTLGSMQWKFLGIMFGRSIFRECISPCINLHPILCYFLQNDTTKLKMRHFFAELEPYYIDYLASMKIILDMNDDEYADFLDLQEEKTLAKTKYVGKYIYDKYIYASLKWFVDGFREVYKNYYYTHCISLISFHNFVRGNVVYDILGDSNHSLKNNLTVEDRTIQIDEKTGNKYNAFEKNTKIFEEMFLIVLDELGKKSFDKLRNFIRFWFGTSSINTFSKHKAVLCITNENFYGCFQSHTCFNTLDIDSTIVKALTLDTIKQNITDMIDNSVKNQELSETVGFRMQFM